MYHLQNESNLRKGSHYDQFLFISLVICLCVNYSNEKAQPQALGTIFDDVSNMFEIGVFFYLFTWSDKAQCLFRCQVKLAVFVFRVCEFDKEGECRKNAQPPLESAQSIEAQFHRSDFRPSLIWEVVPSFLYFCQRLVLFKLKSCLICSNPLIL